MAITNYGREVAGTLTRRADSPPGWMQGGGGRRRHRPHGREARMRLRGRRGVADPNKGAGERERRPRGRDREGITNG